MTTDFRALCAELLDEIQHESPLTCIARTALAEPQPPADGEVGELVAWLLDEAEQAANSDSPVAAGMLTWAAQVAGEHADLLELLAATGKPGLRVQPTDEELLGLDDLRNAWNAQADVFNGWDELGLDEIIWWAQRQALVRWGTPNSAETRSSLGDAPQPIPVTERLPEAGDCDAEGRCWWWHPSHPESGYQEGWMLRPRAWGIGHYDSDDCLVHTHWLPAHALPVPVADELDPPAP